MQSRSSGSKSSLSSAGDDADHDVGHERAAVVGCRVVVQCRDGADVVALLAGSTRLGHSTPTGY